MENFPNPFTTLAAYDLSQMNSISEAAEKFYTALNNNELYTSLTFLCLPTTFFPWQYPTSLAYDTWPSAATSFCSWKQE